MASSMDQGQRIAAALAAGMLLVCAWIFLRWNDRAIDEAFPTLSPAEGDTSPRDALSEPSARQAVDGEPAAPPSTTAEPAAPRPSPVEAPHTATLDVRVLRDGAPASGITVWIASTRDWPLERCLDVGVRAPDGAHSAQTDASGTASFTGIAPAIFRVGLGTGPDPRVARVVTTDFHSGYTYTVLLGSASVRGEVHDSTGRPRKSAGILVRHRVPDAVHLVIAALTSTDAQGAYELGDFAAGSYEVVMDGDGHFDERGDVEVQRLEIEAGREHVVDFGSLAGGLIWKGRVLNAFGEPFAGNGRLQLSRAGSERSGPIEGNGGFVIEFLPGTWELVVYATGSPGGGFELGPIELPANDLERDVVVPGARLTGRVVTADGSTASLAQLRVSAREKGHDYPAAFRTVQTDADGSFRIDGLAPGTWVVGIYPGRLVEGQTIEVTLAPGEPVVELELRWTSL